MTENDDLPAAPAPRMRELSRQLAALTPRRQLDALLERPDLPRVLSLMPPQDVHRLIRAIGIADALELLEQAPPPVLQGLADLSTWRGDRVDPRALASFYAALFQADEEHALDKVLEMDLELMTLFLKLHCRVTDITDDAPASPTAESVITPDHKLQVDFVDPPALPTDEADPLGLGERGRALARGAARQLVEQLIAREPATLTRIMDAIRWELPSQLEEDALRWRTGRMEDLGFPTREEALRVLAFMDPDTPALPPPAPPPPPDEDEDFPDLALARYAAPDLQPREPYLAAAIASLGEDGQDRVARELAVLCNRVGVAREVSPGDADGTDAVVREARTMVDLGLAYRSRARVEGAGPLLAGSSVESLYRVGHSLLLKLQRQARRLLPAEWGTPRELARVLEAPGGMALASLLGRIPLFYAGLTRPGAVEVRTFSTLDDVTAATRSLSESAFRLALGFQVLGLSRERLQKANLAGTNLGDAAEITLEVLFSTALARAAAGGKLDSSPLDAAELQAARVSIKDGAAVQRAGDALGSVAAPRAPLPGCRTPEDVAQRCRALAGVLLAALAEELGGIPADQPVDGKYVTRVLVKA